MYRAKEFRARSFRAFRGNSSPFISVLLSYARDCCCKKRELFRSKLRKNGSIIQIRQISKCVRKRAEYCARRRPIKKCLYRKNKTMVRRYTHRERESLKKRARAHLAESCFYFYRMRKFRGELGNLLFFRSGFGRRWVDFSILSHINIIKDIVRLLPSICSLQVQFNQHVSLFACFHLSIFLTYACDCVCISILSLSHCIDQSPPPDREAAEEYPPSLRLPPPREEYPPPPPRSLRSKPPPSLRSNPPRSLRSKPPPSREE